MSIHAPAGASWRAFLLLAGVVLLAGCATTTTAPLPTGARGATAPAHAAAGAGDRAARPAPSAPRRDGGSRTSTRAAQTRRPASDPPTSARAPKTRRPASHRPTSARAPKTRRPASHRPLAAATMVCNAQIRASIATLLALPASPTPTHTWARHTYTCTYPLAQGRLVMSVRHSPSAAAARRYFTDVKASAGHTSELTGLASLGLPAFQSRTGMVSFVKDTFTLQVDATAMKPALGPHHTSRTSFAYTLATDVLGCWTGK